MSLSHQELSDLIGEIYECALNPTHWETTLERIATVVNACTATIMRNGSDATFFHNWGMPQETMPAYLTTYAALNPLATVHWHCEVDEPISLEQFMTPEELRATRFYIEFIGPLGWFDFILVALEKSDQHASFLSLTRRQRDGAPSRDELQTIRMLAPHLRRALVVQGVLTQYRSEADNLTAIFDAVRLPVLSFDDTGKLLQANDAAQAFLRQLGTGNWARGMLAPRGSDIYLAADVWRQVGTTAPEAPQRDRQSIAMTAPDGRSFIAHVVPLTPSSTGSIQSAAAAMFIQEVGALNPLPGEVLVKLYGLTPAETRLLGVLARGEGLDATAAALGIAITTARTHLQRIFDKTGTSRQAELVRLVLSAFPTPPG
jgi:DNA-binding CsgD family transcriptional regulator/PAS domain-containing protein